jgi:fibronectin-binding autotransporter adhesin
MRSSLQREFRKFLSIAAGPFAALALVVVVTLSASPATANQIITGTGGMSAPHVKRFSGATGMETASFLPYGGFTGGVRVAAGDVNADGTPDIVTGLGESAASHVKAFSGVDQSELKSFFAYGPSFMGGVYVAAGDVDGDGYSDIFTGAGVGGGTHVKVFSGWNNAELHSFFAYPGVTNDVRVAAGDVNGDGFVDIITSLGEGVASHVKVFSGTNLDPLASFFAYGAGFTGGVYVASGDVNNDGRDDIVTGAGVGGSTHVKVFSGIGGGELHSFLAYPGVTNEVRVGAGDVDGDGFADMITGLGPGAAPHVKVFRGNDGVLTLSYFAYPGSYAGGIYVAGVTPATGLIPECSSLAMACIGMMAAASRTALRAARRRAAQGEFAMTAPGSAGGLSH